MKSVFRFFVFFTFFALLSIGANAQFKRGETAQKADELMRRGDWQGAIGILDRAVEQKKDLFEAYRMRATFRSMRGDIDGAITDLTNALEIKPDSAELYHQRARFRQFRRDTQGALKDYDLAIASGLKTEKVYAGRGDIKRDARDFAGAINDYQTAIGINPDFVAAHNGLSITLEQKGDADAAIAAMQNFLDRFEQNRNGKLPKARADNPEAAGVLIKREGADTDGKQVFMQGHSGSFVVKGNSPEEIQSKLELIERNRSLAFAYGTLGRLYEKKGDAEKALQNYDKAILIKGDDGYLRATRGKMRLKNGDVKGAVEDLSAAADAPTGAPDRNADKGILLILLGRDADAQKEFDKHLQMFPNTKDFLDKRIADAKQKRAALLQQHQ
jgi:tetratricopeptide (TPR) repeat protein